MITNGVPCRAKGETSVVHRPDNIISVTSDGSIEDVRPEIMHLIGCGQWQSPVTIADELARFTFHVTSQVLP